MKLSAQRSICSVTATGSPMSGSTEFDFPISKEKVDLSEIDATRSKQVAAGNHPIFARSASAADFTGPSCVTTYSLARLLPRAFTAQA